MSKLAMAFHLNTSLDASPVRLRPERGGLFDISDDPLDAAEYRVYKSPILEQLVGMVPAFSFFDARHRDAPCRAWRQKVVIRFWSGTTRCRTRTGKRARSRCWVVRAGTFRCRRASLC